MSLAHILSQGGNTPDSIRTEAKVQVLKDPDGEGFKIMKIDLATVGRVSGVDAAAFEQAAQERQGEVPDLEGARRRAGDQRQTRRWRAERQSASLAGSIGSAGPVSARLIAHSTTPSASSPPA